MEKVFSDILASLEKGEDVILATIVQSSGSTPRKTGSKMIVYKDGSITGTIGGGAVEGDVIQKCTQLYADPAPLLLAYDFSQSGLQDKLDLICGGKMELLLEHIEASDTNRTLYRQVADAITAAKPLLWTTRTELDGGSKTVEHQLSVLENSGEDVQSGLKVESTESGLFLKESILPGHQVFIVGAGHVGRELARLTQHLGMQTHILDDRVEYGDGGLLPEGGSVRIVPEYSDLFSPYYLGPRSCIVIVTRAHRYDKIALHQALQTNAGYVGMIGSRKKRNTIYDALMAEGVSKSLLDSVHSPIGLDIGGETPEEIAISIAAELIQFKAGK